MCYVWLRCLVATRPEVFGLVSFLDDIYTYLYDVLVNLTYIHTHVHGYHSSENIDEYEISAASFRFPNGTKVTFKKKT